MTEQTTLLRSLVLYRQEPDSLLSRLCSGESDSGAVSDLIQLAVRLGWQGNLWQQFLTYSILEHENPFSLACERTEPLRDTLNQIALQDMEVFLRLFALAPEDPLFPILADFHHRSKASDSAEADQIARLAASLAGSASSKAFLSHLKSFYHRYGVGMLGLHQVFRIKEQNGCTVLYPVEDRQKVYLDDLVGYQKQKLRLMKNTVSFLHRHPANNVLLYGDAGTGKSTSIQALADMYTDLGLRMIEVNKNQFALIPALISSIKNRNYRFILFLDDLSFEENEVEYKYLKSVMEGGAEASPKNVLIYATSNRHHLIRETWNDRSDMEHDGDIHRSETMEEKLSLAGRFGLQIYYPNPSFEEYQTIVQTLAEQNLISRNEDLRAAALAWQVRHGSQSGRSARQFINDLVSQREILP